MSTSTRMRSILHSLGIRSTPSLYYVVPGVNWVLDWVGQYVATNVQSQHGLKAQVVRSANKLHGQIVHYGSLWDLTANIDKPHHGRNWTVGTIFHGQKNQTGFIAAISKLLEKQASFEKI